MVIRNPIWSISQYGCCPRCWLNGVICCVARSCWLSVVFCFIIFVVPSCFPFSSNCFFLFNKSIVVFRFDCFLPLSFLLQIVCCAGFHVFVFAGFLPACSYVVVLTLTRIIKSVVTGQAPVTLELRNTPGTKTQTKGGTRIYHS